jgi:hypothetical protein
MPLRTQRIGVWCGYIFAAAFLVGFLGLARFCPPPNPAGSALEIAARFRGNTLGIRLGMLVCLFTSALLLWWWGSIATQIKRIEGRWSPVTYVLVAGSACFVLEFIFPCMFWATAAFRPEADPELIRKFNDLAWLPFLGVVSTAMVQCFGMAYVVLSDKRPAPVYPRWFGYYNIMSALLFAPADFIIMLKRGPLAWNGVISFYIVFAVFTAWLLVVTFMTNKAISQQQTEPEYDWESGRLLDDRVTELTDQVNQMHEEITALRQVVASAPPHAVGAE